MCRNLLVFLSRVKFFLALACFTAVGAYDATIVGDALFADGLYRLSILALDMLKKDLAVNFIPTNSSINLQDIPLDVQALITHQNKTPAPICLTFSALWSKHNSILDTLPNSFIKLAYSMFEATTIPKEWVALLNTHFDGVVVPDASCLHIYKNSGVTKPIFTLPHPVYLDSFLEQPLRTTPNNPFVFGLSAAFDYRKNIELVVEAFGKAFGNNPQVKLRIHGRRGNKDAFNTIIKKYNLTNVEVIVASLSQEKYIEFMASLDCYILLSRGEGFSVTPREALALGIPCILSNNTAHTTLCATGLVYPVTSKKLCTVVYSDYNDHVSSMYDTDLAASSQAMRKVYTQYTAYKFKALKGREWVKNYSIDSLRPYYLSLLKPKKIIFGKYNKVTPQYLMTNSPALYDKYRKVQAGITR
ncbi:glycosyltransferase [Candidatus Dependentiae bacterium]|nr:glycosyltransferase [Candidatus Dependentiae bacterium]